MSSRADGRSNDPYVLLIATISCTQHLSYSSLCLLVYFFNDGVQRHEYHSRAVPLSTGEIRDLLFTFVWSESFHSAKHFLTIPFRDIRMNLSFIRLKLIPLSNQMLFDSQLSNQMLF